MNKLQKLALDLKGVVLQIRYGSKDKRAYMFYMEDYMDILKDVDHQIGIIGGIPHHFEESHVFETVSGYEISLDPHDWESHDEDQYWDDPATNTRTPVSIPELGEPRLLLKHGGRVWKMTPSHPEPLYHELHIHQKH